MLGPYVDVERALMDLLDQVAPSELWTDETLPGTLPTIQVRRVGGDDNGITDRARVSVTVYAARTSQAKDLAEQARQLLLDGPHTTPNGVIDKATTEVGPQHAPTRDPDTVRARDAIYRVRLRRRST